MFQLALQSKSALLQSPIGRKQPQVVQNCPADKSLCYSFPNKQESADFLLQCRSVPLSEGRIESDHTLQCAYHGWRFNSEGHCTKVPQAESKEEESRITHQSKACVATFPTQVHATSCLPAVANDNQRDHVGLNLVHILHMGAVFVAGIIHALSCCQKHCNL